MPWMIEMIKIMATGSRMQEEEVSHSWLKAQASAAAPWSGCSSLTTTARRATPGLAELGALQGPGEPYNSGSQAFWSQDSPNY